VLCARYAVSSTHHPVPPLLLCAVEVDPHGDRKLSFKLEKEPRAIRDSDLYKNYLHNKAIHAALTQRGHVKDKHGDYPGSFAASDEPRVPGLPLTAKSVGKALGYKEEAPLFPFGNTLKVNRSCKGSSDIACCMRVLAAVGRTWLNGSRRVSWPAALPRRTRSLKSSAQTGRRVRSPRRPLLEASVAVTIRMLTNRMLTLRMLTLRMPSRRAAC